jgi:hypothetical protein
MQGFNILKKYRPQLGALGLGALGLGPMSPLDKTALGSLLYEISKENSVNAPCYINYSILIVRINK